ncbi:ABC transporter ATP-binding protein, partial [Vallitalea maricola]|uniref:ABC transporter ATP-binding protein n=1 Tax=Vallitalea maricola TaxID=3074433 RepID=UPI0030D86FEA
MLLKLKNCYYSYKPNEPILKNISFSIKEGEILAIMGCNGIGKTTLLKCIAGILKWDKGTCIFNGQNTINAISINCI